MIRQHPDVAMLQSRFGIVFPGAMDYRDSQLGMDSARALLMDAAPPYAVQSPTVTVGNAGIPAYLTNFLDPELTRVLTAPMRAVQIFGESKKGDWTTMTAQFPIIESTGEVSSYGDYNNNGNAGANANYEPRQSYHFQTITRWGDRELEMAGLAKIDWAAEQNIASALVINKAMNKAYFFGISGLDNYGLLNDPGLNAPIAATKTWASATGLEIWGDIQRLFKQLQTQLNGNLDMDATLTLAMSPTLQPYMLTPMQNVYGNANVEDMLKKALPNCTVKTAPEYTTAAGELVQLIVDQVDGRKTGFCAFTEKLRAHAIVRDTSSTYQKKSAGTWGSIVKLPAGIAGLLGA